MESAIELTEDKQEIQYIADDTKFSKQIKSNHQTHKPDSFYLYWAVFTVQLLTVVSGTSVVWTSPVIPKLTSNDTQVNPLGTPATTTDISMIAASPIITSLIGALVLPRLSDTIGRRMYLLTMGVGLLISHILLAFSASVLLIVISRCIVGTFLAGSFSVIPIYVTEICEDHNRAKFGCYLGLFHQIGHFYCFIIGPYFSMRILTLLLMIPIIPFLISFFFLPESPAYLLSKGKENKCRQALKKLRNTKDSSKIESEFHKLVESDKTKNFATKSPGYLSFFTNKETKVGFMLALLPCQVQILSGITVIMSFLAPLFNSAKTSISGDHVAIAVGILKISCFFLTSAVVEKLGRKRMLIYSSVGSGLSLFGLGCFFYLKHINSQLLDKLGWLPLTLILSYVGLYSLGIGPIPMAIMHEMFPAEYRAVAGSLLTTIGNIIMFTIVFSFPLITASIGSHWAVWAFSSFCIFGALLIHIFLPETKGKSLSEIQDILQSY
ncbi:facilitated trehalose transporter Tret1-like [Diorhabda sublineata]|uniref:facilitated trehalose transporter Tret1-like n=1 Tax=Diorhabda sublineata TaxID=1163346 RepID=UPI0024E0CA01|nr:facilitated trehalose transporter Tret1-like [Diorhabda sublineata]